MSRRSACRQRDSRCPRPEGGGCRSGLADEASFEETLRVRQGLPERGKGVAQAMTKFIDEAHERNSSLILTVVYGWYGRGVADSRSLRDEVERPRAASRSPSGPLASSLASRLLRHSRSSRRSGEVALSRTEPTPPNLAQLEPLLPPPRDASSQASGSGVPIPPS